MRGKHATHSGNSITTTAVSTMRTSGRVRIPPADVSVRTTSAAAARAAAAVAYGKEHFEKFTRLRDTKEANEVRRLMAAAVYARVGLENSPYKDIERECREIGGVLNPYTFDPDLRKRMEETAKGTEEDLADFEEIGSAWW